jgi:hypothetical protein
MGSSREQLWPLIYLKDPKARNVSLKFGSAAVVRNASKMLALPMVPSLCDNSRGKPSAAEAVLIWRQLQHAPSFLWVN